MRKSRFTEHQIIGILKAVEAGRPVKELCREQGISEGTYYNWKSKYPQGINTVAWKRLTSVD